ncbi:mCG1047181 [Mus musculus]|nr:mCG1047181 [Mus musculus]
MTVHPPYSAAVSSLIQRPSFALTEVNLQNPRVIRQKCYKSKVNSACLPQVNEGRSLSL